MSLYKEVLRELQHEDPAQAFPGAGGYLPGERYPALHERQIEDNNQAWVRERDGRLERHGRRVREHLRRHSRRKAPGEATNGRRQRVWCVELRRSFASLSEAADFVGRAPSNVLQAIRFHIRCGTFHWERFDPQKHGPPTPDDSCGEGRSGCASASSSTVKGLGGGVDCAATSAVQNPVAGDGADTSEREHRVVADPPGKSGAPASAEDGDHGDA